MYSLRLISIVFYYWQHEHFFLANEGSFSFGKNSFIQRISITIKYLWAVLFQFPIDFEVICFNWEQSFTSPNLYCKNSPEYCHNRFIPRLAHKQACSVHCTIYSLWTGIIKNLLVSPALSCKKRSCFGHVINPLLIVPVQACLVKMAGYILTSFFLSGPSLHLCP